MMVKLPKIKYYLCVRMYVCILLCMLASMSVCMYGWMDVYVRTYVRTYTYVCMYASTHILYVCRGLHVYHVCNYIKYVDMAEQ